MTISERLFDIMRQQNISMPELSRMTGISRHTIFDWQRRGTNPGADKIMVMHHGRIRESGTHQELLQKNGIYKRLYELQLE